MNNDYWRWEGRGSTLNTWSSCVNYIFIVTSVVIKSGMFMLKTMFAVLTRDKKAWTFKTNCGLLAHFLFSNFQGDYLHFYSGFISCVHVEFAVSYVVRFIDHIMYSLLLLERGWHCRRSWTIIDRKTNIDTRLFR